MIYDDRKMESDSNFDLCRDIFFNNRNGLCNSCRCRICNELSNYIIPFYFVVRK